MCATAARGVATMHPPPSRRWRFRPGGRSTLGVQGRLGLARRRVAPAAARRVRRPGAERRGQAVRHATLPYPRPRLVPTTTFRWEAPRCAASRSSATGLPCAACGTTARWTAWTASEHSRWPGSYLATLWSTPSAWAAPSTPRRYCPRAGQIGSRPRLSVTSRSLPRAGAFPASPTSWCPPPSSRSTPFSGSPACSPPLLCSGRCRPGASDGSDSTQCTRWAGGSG
mmetsp:Transcript_35668/g.114794  ORF Transcript_35668/g.114794 Transcript_35668/m.114794 type:complete len:226 (+) Transcript_35668:996-1673(+)